MMGGFDESTAWADLPECGPPPSAPARQYYPPAGPRCPLPVLRYDGDRDVQYVAVCGEALSITQTLGHSLDGDGLGYEEPGVDLRCYGGHVLLVPDMEDTEAELTPALLAEALDVLRRCAS